MSYVVGLAGLTAFVLFVSGVRVLGRRIDAGGTAGHLAGELAVDLGLVALFGLQHSIMARPRFKQAWRRRLPAATERSAFVLLSGLLLFAMCVHWRPIGGTLWRVQGEGPWIAVVAVQMLGWSLALAATLQVGHFELMGLSQAHAALLGRLPPSSAAIRDRYFYRLVRHPQQLGLLLGLWAAPEMSDSRAVLSGALTAYVLVGLRLEEKDLLATFGRRYEAYRLRVGMLVPRIRRGQRLRV